MDAKTLGTLSSLVLWPASACLAIWLAAGGMPAAIETPFVTVLWGLVALLSVNALGLALTPLLIPLGELTAPRKARFDRLVFYCVNPCRLALIVALVLAGNPALAACFLAGFLGVWTLTARNRRRMNPPDD